jgi:hypothetical protein
MDYIDDYPSCERTYATMIIYTGTASPIEVSQFLGIVPTRMNLANPEKGKVSAWFLSTKGELDSRDCRRHIDWLLDIFFPLSDKIIELQRRGMRFEVSCFWSSAVGNGGPTLSTKQMARLLPLSIDIWWDVWIDS